MTSLVLSDVRDRVYSHYRSKLSVDSQSDDRESRAPYIRNLIDRHFPIDREVQILDLGCGAGTLIDFLRTAGYKNVRGVDISTEQVQRAHELGIVGVQQGDLFETLDTMEPATVDVVVSFDIIEHMTKPELLQFGDEVYRVLKPEGKWIVHAPNAESPMGSVVRYGDWTHEQAFTRSSLNQFFQATKFKSLNVYEDRLIIHGVKSASRWIMWQLIRTALRVYNLAETGVVGGDSVLSRNLLAVGTK